MDIKNELREVSSDNDVTTRIIENIVIQQEELEKKLHIFKVINLANKLEKAIENGIFDNPKVKVIGVVFNYSDFIYGDIGYYLKNDDMILALYEDDTKIHFNKAVTFLKEIFNELGKFTTSNVNSMDNEEELILEVGIKEKILEILLSDELKKVYEYNKMHADLAESNQINNKKLKV